MLALPFPDSDARHFADLAADSIVEQMRTEASDTMPFETYRQHYLAPARLRPRRNGEAADPLVTAPAHANGG
jgi:hypothetical protein